MSCSQVTPIDFSALCDFALSRVISHISAHLLCYSEKRDSVKPFLPSVKYFADFTWPDLLRTGKFNHRLLSELICHKDFQRLMLDAEIYVDRIADMRVNDMNTVLEATRQMVLMEHGEEADDLYLHTLKAAQIQEEEYFGHLVVDDLSNILRDIREEHRTDTLTADDDLSAAAV